jgi:diaminohydroxyphosphoribosylaminopyrimidine deaminase/5-amino-6-(5-phosphoribosylamino)uracil reductase
MTTSDVIDEQLMERARIAARDARTRSAPNPWVGAVVVADGAIVGEGATAAAGGPHAEVAALAAAGPGAAGATAYVTLEPCSHHGRTPPCADALIAAGVARVVVALEDPDPLVAGTGIARLRDAGISVTVGVGADAVADDLAPYLLQRRLGRAFALVKTAMSLDGRTAAADGSSQWITGPAARADGHRLRAESQAVVVGPGTARQDRPSLTVRDHRPAPEHPPLRVVLDARGQVEAEGPLFDVAGAPTLVVSTDQAPPARVDEWLAAGATVARVAPGPAGRGVDLEATLRLLAAEHGVLQAMVEGGGRLHGALVEAGLADRIVAYVAPILLGAAGTPAFGDLCVESLGDSPRWHLQDSTRLGDDVRLTLVPRTA